MTAVDRESLLKFSSLVLEQPVRLMIPKNR
jgi:hypothetical protein